MHFFSHRLSFNFQGVPGGKASLDEEQALFIKTEIEKLSKLTKVSMVLYNHDVNN